MDKTQKTAATAAVVGLAVVVVTRKWQSLYRDLEGRFPNTDKKLLRKAFNKFMLNSVAGKYNDRDLDNYTDEQMDELFLDIMFHIDPWHNVKPFTPADN